MLSCEQKQNVIDGKKRIILNPSEGQKRDFEAAAFAEGDVWGIDVLVSTGEDGKVRCPKSSLIHGLNPYSSSFRLASKSPGQRFTSAILLSHIS